MLSKMFLMLLVLSLSACTTVSGKKDSPVILAGKSLVAIQGEIVEIRNDISVPCQKGLIPQKDCIVMDDYYQQTKPLYDAAVDAQVLALTSTNPTDQVQAQAKRNELLKLSSELAAIAIKYGIKAGGGK